MKKFRLLLLDANVVIELFRLGIWDKLVDLCEIHLARTVAEREAHFFLDENDERSDFDLSPYVEDKKICVFDVTLSDAIAFREQFHPVYFEKLDPGETESLAFLLNSGEDCRLCSGDKIVFRVLGSLSRGDQGMSLEEILYQVGLGRPLSQQYSKAYRERWTKTGFREGLQGLSMKR